MSAVVLAISYFENNSGPEVHSQGSVFRQTSVRGLNRRDSDAEAIVVVNFAIF